MKEKGYGNINNKADKNTAKDALKVTAALVLTAAVALGSLFSGPDDITAEQAESILNPEPIVLDLSSLPENVSEEASPEEPKKNGIRERLRAAILKLPLWTRILIIVPLQALGALIIWLAGLLAAQLTSSVAGILLPTLVAAALTALLFGATAKLLFPDMPWREIFSRRNLALLLISGAVMAAADFIAAQYVEGYLLVSVFMKVTLCLLFVNIMIFRIRRRRVKAGMQG